MLVMLGAMAVHAAVENAARSDDAPRGPLRRTLYGALVVSYLVLPSVSGLIFKARKCESFGFDDFALTLLSYLVADLDVLSQCS
jgi:hypothetical protein